MSLFKNTLVNISISILSVLLITLFVGLIIESYLHFNDPSKTLPFNGRNQAGEYYTWGHKIKNNNFGFRDDLDIVTPKPKGIFKIIVLGDSLTWGAGLATEERYTNLLSRHLKEEFEESVFEVLNLAYSGAPLIAYRNRLVKYIDVLDPDLIIVGFCLNDPQPRSQDYSIEREQFLNENVALLAKIKTLFHSLGFTYLSNRVKKSAITISQNLGLIPHWTEAMDRVYNKESQEWQQFLIALQEIKDISDSHKLPDPVFLVLNSGTSTDRPTDYNNPDGTLLYFLRWFHQAEDTAKKLGYVTGNVENRLAREYTEKSMAINILDGHPNTNVNEFYAEKLYSLIKNHHATVLPR